MSVLLGAGDVRRDRSRERDAWCTSRLQRALRHPFLDAWHSGAMRFVRPVVAVLLIAVGTVWAIQGYGTLRGSFMSGSPLWLWIGIVCVVGGVVILVWPVLTHRDPGRRT